MEFYERFELRTICGVVVLVHRDCDRVVVGAPGDGVGTGDPEDNTLGRLMFLAQDHHHLYCTA